MFDKTYNITGLNVSRFTPTDEEFLAVDSLIEKYIVKYSTKQTFNNEPIKNYQAYYKQVFGLINGSNNKILFVNGFCNVSRHEYWREKIVSVRGGGSCYFNLKVNLKTHKIFDFRINDPR